MKLLLCLSSALIAVALPLPEESAPLHLRRELLSQSTSYCYLNADGGARDQLHDIPGCSAEPTDAPACVAGAASSESPLCSLRNKDGVDSHRWFDSYAFDHCQSVQVYVRADASEHYYCMAGGLSSTGDWSTRRRDSAGGGNPETSNDGSWGCWWKSGYSWVDGACRHRTRFLGETCQDEVGICQNDGVDSYSGLHLSCAIVPNFGITTPTCIPSAFDITRNSCSCGWFDWWFGVVCGAADSQCYGHPCVRSTGPGGWMCDYNQGNDW